MKHWMKMSGLCCQPCYEPEFRQPEAALSRANHRGGKEEKKTLLGNMELPPDDLYWPRRLLIVDAETLLQIIC